MGKHNLFIGGGKMWFIGENLRRAKGFKYLIFFLLSHVCFLLWGFNGYKEWIIQLN
jgi:hypothetical protein